MKKPWIVSACSIVCVALGCWYLTANHSRERFKQRWVTLEESKQSFESGVLTKGQPPADVKIEMIEPKPDQLQSIKPNHQQKFLVRIMASECESAPSFATLKIQRNNRTVKICELTPAYRTQNWFSYINTINMPEVEGSYDIIISVNYQILDLQGKSPKSLKPFRQNLQWGSFRVKK